MRLSRGVGSVGSGPRRAGRAVLVHAVDPVHAGATAGRREALALVLAGLMSAGPALARPPGVVETMPAAAPGERAVTLTSTGASRLQRAPTYRK